MLSKESGIILLDQEQSVGLNYRWSFLMRSVRSGIFSSREWVLLL
jgi:hypothetical protein